MRPQNPAARVIAAPERHPRAALLTLQFPVAVGAAPHALRATCFRFGADGTCRSGDNSIAATRENEGWRTCRGLYKDLECIGPVVVRVRKTRNGATESLGPFDFMRVTSGLLIGDAGDLDIRLPTWQLAGTVSLYEIVLQAVQRPD
jgi:hypothetical protein